MIPLNELRKLSESLPKAKISTPENNGTSWILDANGEKIGAIQWNIAEIHIYESYEYADQVREAIGEERFEDIRQDFPISEEPPVTFEGDEPELTDYGKSLYQEP